MTILKLESSADKRPPPVQTSVRADPYMNKVHEINGHEELDRIIADTQNSNRLIVCDFHAVWCQPCLRCAPMLSKWALNDYKTSVVFVKVDVDQNGDLANQFAISVLPTFVLLKKGKEISRSTGGDLTELRREIDRLK